MSVAGLRLSGSCFYTTRVVCPQFIARPGAEYADQGKKAKLFTLLSVYIVAHRHGMCIIRAITTEIDMTNSKTIDQIILQKVVANLPKPEERLAFKQFSSRKGLVHRL